MPCGYTFSHSTWKGPPALLSTLLRALCLLLMKTVPRSSAFVLMPQSPFLTYPKGTMAEVLPEVEFSPHVHSCGRSLALSISGELDGEGVTFLHLGQGRCRRVRDHCSFSRLPFHSSSFQPCLAHSQGGKLSGSAYSRRQTRREINVLCPGLPPRGPQGRALSQLLSEVTFAI